MEIPNPAGRSVPGRCQPSQPTRRTAEPASSPGTRRTISFINVASAASLAEGERRALCRTAGAQRSGSSRHGNAAASECQQRHRERDSCSNCQGTAVPGLGARHPSPVPCPLSPFPSPPPAPSSPHLHVLLRQSHTAKREALSGVVAPGGCTPKTRLGCSQGCRPPPELGPLPAERLLCHGKPHPRSTPCPGTPPLSCSPPAAMPVLAPFTSAGPVSPAPGAHRGSSAAAPPGFLHLRGGSDAAGETAHGGFWGASPPPSTLLSQRENVPIPPLAPAGFHIPQTSPRVSTTGDKPHRIPTPQTLQAPPRGDPARDPDGDSPSSVPSLSPVRTASSCLSLPGSCGGGQGCCRSNPLLVLDGIPKRASPRGSGGPNPAPSRPSHLADALRALLAPGHDPVRVPLGTAHPPWGQKGWWQCPLASLALALMEPPQKKQKLQEFPSRHRLAGVPPNTSTFLRMSPTLRSSFRGPLHAPQAGGGVGMQGEGPPS